MRAVGALLAASVFLMIGTIASAQKVVSPPEIAPPIPLKPPFPSAREQSRAPQTEPSTEQQHPADDHRGTEQSPLIVKIQPAPNGSAEAAQAEREKENEAADKWRADIIAIAIAAAAAVQAAALISTIIVMMCSARKQLRAYVNVADAKFYTVPGGYPPNIVLTMKNFGTTPARNVSFREHHFLAVPGAETFDRLNEPCFSG